MARVYHFWGRIAFKTKIKLNPSLLFSNDLLIKVHLGF